MTINHTNRFIVSAAGLAAVIVSFSLIGRASVPDVASNTWATTGDMAAARAGASAVLLYDGRVLVTGGLTEITRTTDDGPITVTNATASAERFSPAGGGFLDTPPMQFARASHTSTLLPDGRVLVVGGVGPDGIAISSVEIYDPSTNSWSAGAPLHYARSGHTATALYDGRVVIAGGNDGANPLDSIEMYDVDAGTFALSNAVLGARTGHAAALLYDGKVFITGGISGTDLLDSTVVYDPWEDTITAGPALTVARAGHSATTLLHGKVLVAGGAGPESELVSGEVYDPATNSLAPAANPMIAARQHHQAILLPHNNQVLIVGGTAGGNAVTTAEVYVEWQGNGGTFYPTNAPTMTTRAWATASALSQPAGLTIRTGPNDGLMLLAGGSASSNVSAPAKSAELYGFATVKTDFADYAPGDTVTITGSGWVPNETVTLALVEDPLRDIHTLHAVTADASGNIISTEFKPDQDDLNVRFYLTATGSLSQAQTSFTDALTNTDTMIKSKRNPSNLGDSVTFEATVVKHSDKTKVTSGTVTFALGGNANCSGTIFGTSTLDALGQASASYQFTSAGSFTVRACYTDTPPATFNSSGDNLSQTVNATAATTTAAGNATATYGDTSVTLSAAVTSNSSVNTGTVTFTVKQGGNVIGSPTTSGTVSGGTASVTYGLPAGTAAGSYTIEAVYNAGSGFNGSSDSGHALTVNPAGSTTVVTVNNAVYDGAPHGGTAAVNGAGGLETTAAVHYVGRNETSYTESTTPPTAAGDYTATATFAGDANHTGSSDSKDFSIAKAESQTLVTVGNAVYDGNPHGGTAAVTGAGGLETTATVHYVGRNGTSYSDSTTAPTGAGDYTATASYAGDANHKGSNDSKDFSIAKAESQTVVTVANAVYDGNPHSGTAAVTGAGGLETTAPVHYVGRNGTSYSDSTTAPTGAGDYTATASYAGDANHKGSNDSKDFTIVKATPTVNITWVGGTYTGNQWPAAATVTGVNNSTVTLPLPTFTYYSGASVATGTALSGAPVLGINTVRATFSGNDNYTSAYADKTITIAYGWNGFSQPINDTAHQIGLAQSKFKLGQTIPAKFVITNAAGTVVQQTSNPTFTRSGKLGECGAAEAESVTTETPNVIPQYSWDGSQYHYNWSTKGLVAGVYRIFANLADGTSPYVDICLTK